MGYNARDSLPSFYWCPEAAGRDDFTLGGFTEIDCLKVLEPRSLKLRRQQGCAAPGSSKGGCISRLLQFLGAVSIPWLEPMSLQSLLPRPHCPHSSSAVSNLALLFSCKDTCHRI